MYYSICAKRLKLAFGDNLTIISGEYTASMYRQKNKSATMHAAYKRNGIKVLYVSEWGTSFRCPYVCADEETQCIGNLYHPYYASEKGKHMDAKDHPAYKKPRKAGVMPGCKHIISLSLII
jgi:hypothetical protein